MVDVHAVEYPTVSAPGTADHDPRLRGGSARHPAADSASAVSGQWSSAMVMRTDVSWPSPLRVTVTPGVSASQSTARLGEKN